LSTTLSIVLYCFWNYCTDLERPLHKVSPSDGSGSKFFDPGWVNFLWLGLGWVRSGQPSMIWVWVWKIPPKNIKFFKKNLFWFGQKVPGWKAGRPLIFCGSKVSSGRVKAHLYCLLIYLSVYVKCQHFKSCDSLIKFHWKQVLCWLILTNKLWLYFLYHQTIRWLDSSLDKKSWNWCRRRLQRSKRRRCWTFQLWNSLTSQSVVVQKVSVKASLFSQCRSILGLTKHPKNNCEK